MNGLLDPQFAQAISPHGHCRHEHARAVIEPSQIMRLRFLGAGHQVRHERGPPARFRAFGHPQFLSVAPSSAEKNKRPACGERL